MTSVVLIAHDRVGLARTGEALKRAGYQVESGYELADAEILIRAANAEALVVDVDENIMRDLEILEQIIQNEPNVEVIMVLGPMPPPAEQKLIEATRALGVELHLPRQLTATPFFASVINVALDRHRLYLANGSTTDTAFVPPARPDMVHTSDGVPPDYQFLKEQLAYELSLGPELSLMMVEIDDFDEIWQKRGQRAAEQLVQDLTDLLKADLRDTDVVTRTEVLEKLAVILPLTKAVQAKIVASRIQVKLARRSLGTASLSAGIAEATAGLSAEDLIQIANKALEKAKEIDDKLYAVTGPYD